MVDGTLLLSSGTRSLPHSIAESSLMFVKKIRTGYLWGNKRAPERLDDAAHDVAVVPNRLYTPLAFGERRKLARRPRREEAWPKSERRMSLNRIKCADLVVQNLWDVGGENGASLAAFHSQHRARGFRGRQRMRVESLR